MGGGTGSGAAPIIAAIARDMKCLTVGVVTKPFSFEGKQRMVAALNAIEEFKKHVDALIIIPNDRLLQITGKFTPYLDAFRMADNVLRQAVQGITEVIDTNGIINVDFADIRTVLKDKGTALMGIGVAKGETRTKDAAQLAIKSSLLETSINGATSAIVNITSSISMSLYDINEVLNEIKNATTTELNVIVGSAINPDLGDEIVVTVIATGFANDPLNDATASSKTGEISDEDDENDRETASFLDSKPENKAKKTLFGPKKKDKPTKKEKDKNDTIVPPWLAK